MEGILNDLDDITFNMKKAKQIIAEITRGFITDKYGVHLYPSAACCLTGPHRMSAQ